MGGANAASGYKRDDGKIVCNKWAVGDNKRQVADIIGIAGDKKRHK